MSRAHGAAGEAVVNPHSVGPAASGAETMPRVQTARIVALDGLRAVAVGLVFAYHAYPSYFPGGFIGVDIFFVISGFVITRTLLRDGLNYRRFYVHRFFRVILPALPVLACVLAVSAMGHQLAASADVAYALFSVMNWVRALGISTGEHLGHFWSLSIEEQFYLLWPLVMAGLVYRSARPVRVILTIIGALAVWYLVMVVSAASLQRIYNGLDTHAIQLMAGCLLAFLRLDRPLPVILLVVPMALILACVPIITWDGSLYATWGIPTLGFLSFLIVAQLASGDHRLHAVLKTAPFQWGGSRSYAIYLWHYPVLGLLFAAGASHGFAPYVSVTGSLLLTCALAEISYRLIERPSIGLRKRFDGTIVELKA